ncbi:glycosyltransferase family 2 protein [Slackia isoflavoniconvertens]|uniref:glycosyltransferase family 2 protein n=1 Tax=Slackia isoflavoniconvertens TaxID=572010 RepID=UPI003AB98D00
MGNSRPLISVIVPVYNSSGYLKECIGSILGQSESNIELIIVDDQSTDNSLDIVRQFSEHDPRVVLVANEKNIGQGLSRNKGIELSRGRFIAFVDSDDTIDLRMYAILLSAAAEHGAQMARCSFRRVASLAAPAVQLEERIPTRCLFGNELKRYLNGYFGMLPSQALSDAPSMSPCTALYDGDAIRRKGIRFPSERIVRSEDLFFNIEASACVEKLVVVDVPLYNYLVRPGSTTRTYSSPIGKCELLEKYAPDGEEYSLRITRSHLTAVKEATVQLALSGRSIPESAREVRDLEKRLRLKERLSAYPVGELPGRERIFAFAARFGLGLSEALMGRLDIVRKGL